MIKRWYGIYKDICVKYVLPISVVGFCWNWFGGFVRTSYMVNYQQGIDWDMERLQNHTEMSIETFYYLAENLTIIDVQNIQNYGVMIRFVQGLCCHHYYLQLIKKFHLNGCNL